MEILILLIYLLLWAGFTWLAYWLANKYLVKPVVAAIEASTEAHAK